jgi:hypothetical protein
MSWGVTARVVLAAQRPAWWTNATRVRVCTPAALAAPDIPSAVVAAVCAMDNLAGVRHSVSLKIPPSCSACSSSFLFLFLRFFFFCFFFCLVIFILFYFYFLMFTHTYTHHYHHHHHCPFLLNHD